MKRFLIMILMSFLLTGLSVNGQGYLGNQSSWEAQLYHSIEPSNRITGKILTTFHHDYTGTSHMGLVFERFTFSDYTVGSWAVEAAYIFDNIPIGKHKRWEIGPIVNMGMMYYDKYSNWRLQLGADLAYRINGNLAVHIAYLTGNENYYSVPIKYDRFVSNEDVRERRNVVTLGLSFRPYFNR